MIFYSVVIATRDRPEYLRDTLGDLALQTHKPGLVIVVDASDGDASRQVSESISTLAVRWIRAAASSSARQRNQGAQVAETPLIAFVDDDVRLPPDLFSQLTSAFEDQQTGAVSARIIGMEHPRPRNLLRWYYRIQAGYAHSNYGAKLFGPAINCLPCYSEETRALVPAEWLNSTCTLYRREVFLREEFPEFDGYSYLEDVHLSARVARTHRIYFHASACYEHLDAPSTAKSNRFRLGRMRIRNQKIVARDVMNIPSYVLIPKLLLHRLFISFVLVRNRHRGWVRELLGTWLG